MSDYPVCVLRRFSTTLDAKGRNGCWSITAPNGKTAIFLTREIKSYKRLRRLIIERLNTIPANETSASWRETFFLLVNGWIDEFKI